MNYQNADNSGNDIGVISGVTNHDDVLGWFWCFVMWGQWKKNQIFYNQNPIIPAMDSHIEHATTMQLDDDGHPHIFVDSTQVTGTEERTLWFMNLSKIEECPKYKESVEQMYQTAGVVDGVYENLDRVEGLTSENTKVTELPVEPFEVGNYKVTQEMIDENPDNFRLLGINNQKIPANIYDIHPECRRICQEIFDRYLPSCEEVVGKKFKKEFRNAYLNRNAFGDSVWTHRDPFDYTLVVYLNPAFDLRKWGGETMFFNDDLTFCRGAVSPKPETACLFKSDIPHKVTGVSWECGEPRMALTFYLELEDAD